MSLHLTELNQQYLRKDPYNRLQNLFSHFAPADILVTSSFGITAGVLLSMVHSIAPNHPIYFLDTTYHFPETLAYKEQLQA
ncbi:MAG: phosphoadenosine phosphosulfate reductase family protein, partial [Chitinophagales bacterium]|nr:phosphoadenosine phosphosulfate reductase family protein [Chitinophagales bacterium]